MKSIEQSINELYGNKLRVRVCGILVVNDEILLIKHKSINETGVFWSPPGGGIDFGETSENALKREFLEETGLEIEVSRFLFTYEFIKQPLHGIELYFEVKIKSGKLILGKDPEMIENQQIIEEIKWLNMKQIKNLGQNSIHFVFSKIEKLEDLLKYNSEIISKTPEYNLSLENL